MGVCYSKKCEYCFSKMKFKEKDIRIYDYLLVDVDVYVCTVCHNETDVFKDGVNIHNFKDMIRNFFI